MAPPPLSSRMPDLTHRLWVLVMLLVILCLGGALVGCGLLMDAAGFIDPILPDLPDEIAAICRHGQVRVGITNEPAPPFIIVTTEADGAPQITGLDIELLQTITAAMTRECQRPVIALPTVLPFRDLFIELTEGHVDLFLSAMAANVPHLTATGIGYSAPYFADTGIIGLTANPRVAEAIRAVFERLHNPYSSATRKSAFHGLTVAVQEERSPHLFAAARLTGARLLVCDTLAAAFRSEPPPDVVLGKQATLQVVNTGDASAWKALTLNNQTPLLLAREHYAIAMAETNYRLRWLVNDVLFELEQSGRLADMHRRWMDPDYTKSADALSHAVPCPACETTPVRSTGRCRGMATVKTE